MRYIYYISTYTHNLVPYIISRGKDHVPAFESNDSNYVINLQGDKNIAYIMLHNFNPFLVP